MRGKVANRPMKGRSDKPLTIALSLSLIAHAGLGTLLLRERIAELARELHRPPISAEELGIRSGRDDAESEPPVVLMDPPAQTVQDFALADPPRTPPPPLPPEKPKKDVEENSEWGEKGGSGTAVTSTPGVEQLTTPKKGNQDQAFASRDPRGPQPRPDEPSPSTVTPGENDDGQRSMRQALERLGTQANATDAPGDGLKAPATPPLPIPARRGVARDDRGATTPERSGQASSRMPLPERQSPAEVNRPDADREGLPNDAAWGEAGQILPVKRLEVIGVRSSAPAYPQVVAALTRAPGAAASPDPLKPFAEPVLLRSAAVADVPAAPAVQPATSSLTTALTDPEEIATRVGESSPVPEPAVIEALTHVPDERSVAGGASVLPEVATADEPSGPTVADAIVGPEADRPRIEEMAQRVETPADEAATATADAPSSSAPSKSVASARGGLPGPVAEAADPAPDTGLESDPFSKTPGIEFRDGKIAARSGRQVKPVRPRLTEPAKRDLLGLQFPTILAKVRIDKTGKVVDVTVLRGSGSQAVDMPVYRALWDWWFEPPKDKKGNPLDDVQLVAIHWG
jgi:hypothetical protein